MKTLLSALALVALAVTPARADDLARLQGTWTVVLGSEKEFKGAVVIKDHTVTADGTTSEGKEFHLKGEFQLDEKASPKTIDWVKFKKADGESLPDNLGIYEFVNDNEVKVCNGGSGNPRPTEFKSGEDGPPILVVLKRAKAATSLKGDLGKFQGTWKTSVGPEKNIPLVLRIKGQDITVAGTTPNGQEFELRGEIRLDDAARPNKTIDWVNFVRADGEDAPANLGIYQFDNDDTLTICNGGPGNERPSEFKAGEGGHPNLLVLKREKE